MAKLAEQFVCVRIQSMNGVNINLFKFDGDLTWMAFFMDAHDHFYARYGGREDSGPETLLTKGSLLKVMQQVLRLHEAHQVQDGYGEQTAAVVRIPDEIPNMKARLAKGRHGNRCIHCHDVKQAELVELRRAGNFSRNMIFSFPVPLVVGLGLDRDDQQKVASVKPGSPASKADVRAGDILQALDGKRLLTAADFAWVLERAGKDSILPLNILRDGQPYTKTLKLSGDWRKTSDPSWRSSTYVAGPNAGIWAEPLTEAQKQKAGLARDALALRITVFFGGTTPAKSGLKLNDVLIEFDGKREPMTIRQLHTHCQMNHEYGDKAPITVLREGKEMKLTLELPASPAGLN